jgi:hypothetical protein
VAASAAQDPEGFFTRCPKPALIDEVQFAPELFRHLKSTVDTERQNTGQYILTGSQKFGLMQSVSESLAGRAAIPETRHVESFVVCRTLNAFPTGKAAKAVNLLALNSVVG